MAQALQKIMDQKAVVAKLEEEMEAGKRISTASWRTKAGGGKT